jgi:ribosomal protein S27E
MTTKNVRVLVGKRSDKEPAADKIGKSSSKKPKEEVTGRSKVLRLMQCWNCGALTWIEYDTSTFIDVTCAICGAMNAV